MKKFLFILGVTVFIYGSNFCLAGEFGLEVKDDQYGGKLYCYLDQDGNRSVTNSIDCLPDNIISTLKIKRAGINENTARETDQVLAENTKTGGIAGKDKDDYLDEYEDDEAVGDLADPFEPINRFFFEFNDKFYFLLLKPVSIVYRDVFPSPVRTSIGNFFENITYPVRFVSCLLQGKIEGAVEETGRFLTNSTIGLAGLFDPATELLNMKKHDEDLGQTFGFWGLGHGFFLNFPFLGPSSLRDGIGQVGDNYLDPLQYLCPDFSDRAAFKATEVINSTSLRIGDYEDLKEASIDPYVAFRDAYRQLRAKQVAE